MHDYNWGDEPEEYGKIVLLLIAVAIILVSIALRG